MGRDKRSTAGCPLVFSLPTPPPILVGREETLHGLSAILWDTVSGPADPIDWPMSPPSPPPPSPITARFTSTTSSSSSTTTTTTVIPKVFPSTRPIRQTKRPGADFNSELPDNINQMALRIKEGSKTRYLDPERKSSEEIPFLETRLHPVAPKPLTKKTVSAVSYMASPAPPPITPPSYITPKTPIWIDPTVKSKQSSPLTDETRPTTAIITGPMGIGKTALVLTYAHEALHGNKGPGGVSGKGKPNTLYPQVPPTLPETPERLEPGSSLYPNCVWYIPAQSHASIDASFAALAEALLTVNELQAINAQHVLVKAEHLLASAPDSAAFTAAAPSTSASSSSSSSPPSTSPFPSSPFSSSPSSVINPHHSLISPLSAKSPLSPPPAPYPPGNDLTGTTAVPSPTFAPAVPPPASSSSPGLSSDGSMIKSAPIKPPPFAPALFEVPGAPSPSETSSNGSSPAGAPPPPPIASPSLFSVSHQQKMAIEGPARLCPSIADLRREAVLEKLANIPGWLLIFDNVNSITGVEKWIPRLHGSRPESRQHVIIIQPSPTSALDARLYTLLQRLPSFNPAVAPVPGSDEDGAGAGSSSPLPGSVTHSPRLGTSPRLGSPRGLDSPLMGSPHSTGRKKPLNRNDPDYKYTHRGGHPFPLRTHRDPNHVIRLGPITNAEAVAVIHELTHIGATRAAVIVARKSLEHLKNGPTNLPGYAQDPKTGCVGPMDEDEARSVLEAAHSVLAWALPVRPPPSLPPRDDPAALTFHQQATILARRLSNNPTALRIATLYMAAEQVSIGNYTRSLDVVLQAFAPPAPVEQDQVAARAINAAVLVTLARLIVACPPVEGILSTLAFLSPGIPFPVWALSGWFSNLEPAIAMLTRYGLTRLHMKAPDHWCVDTKLKEPPEDPPGFSTFTLLNPDGSRPTRRIIQADTPYSAAPNTPPNFIYQGMEASLSLKPSRRMGRTYAMAKAKEKKREEEEAAHPEPAKDAPKPEPALPSLLEEQDTLPSLPLVSDAATCVDVPPVPGAVNAWLNLPYHSHPSLTHFKFGSLIAAQASEDAYVSLDPAIAKVVRRELDYGPIGSRVNIMAEARKRMVPPNIDGAEVARFPTFDKKSIFNFVPSTMRSSASDGSPVGAIGPSALRTELSMEELQQQAEQEELKAKVAEEEQTYSSFPPPDAVLLPPETIVTSISKYAAPSDTASNGSGTSERSNTSDDSSKPNLPSRKGKPALSPRSAFPGRTMNPPKSSGKAGNTVRVTFYETTRDDPFSHRDFSHPRQAISLHRVVAYICNILDPPPGWVRVPIPGTKLFPLKGARAIAPRSIRGPGAVFSLRKSQQQTGGHAPDLVCAEAMEMFLSRSRVVPGRSDEQLLDLVPHVIELYRFVFRTNTAEANALYPVLFDSDHLGAILEKAGSTELYQAMMVRSTAMSLDGMSPEGLLASQRLNSIVEWVVEHGPREWAITLGHRLAAAGQMALDAGAGNLALSILRFASGTMSKLRDGPVSHSLLGVLDQIYAVHHPPPVEPREHHDEMIYVSQVASAIVYRFYAHWAAGDLTAAKVAMTDLRQLVEPVLAEALRMPTEVDDMTSVGSVGSSSSAGSSVLAALAARSLSDMEDNLLELIAFCSALQAITQLTSGDEPGAAVTMIELLEIAQLLPTATGLRVPSAAATVIQELLLVGNYAMEVGDKSTLKMVVFTATDQSSEDVVARDGSSSAAALDNLATVLTGGKERFTNTRDSLHQFLGSGVRGVLHRQLSKIFSRAMLLDMLKP